MFEKHPGSTSLALIGGAIAFVVLKNILIAFLSFIVLFAFFSTWSEKRKK